MEDKLVSKHILDASQYVGKGKWKGVIQGWVVFLIIHLWHYTHTKRTTSHVRLC